ncbi:MAG: alpha/beta hydrolase family protein [Candidatus Binatia bacterium]
MAQDTCLGGASELADERALAALRTATEAACPCAGFDGAGGRRRFRRCARAVVETAVGDATLRPECRARAQADVNGTACGTNRVVCGQLAAAGPDCRLAAPAGRNQCADHGSIDETACAAGARCLDVVEWTAGTCHDPRRPGPYGAGVRVVPMVKDSVNMPGTDRLLDTVVWYPAAPDAAPIDTVYDAVLDAPLNMAGGPYPVLMFSHGSCGYAAQSTFLMPVIASHGFVVIAPPHPGNTLAEFPTCGTPAAQGAAVQERPADIAFALDQMLAANQDAGSPFFGALDPERIGMSGHSFGGLTTYVSIARDRRYKVAMPMAPAVLGTPVVDIPSLSMLGEIDSRVNNAAVRATYENASLPKFKVEIGDAGHYAFSDACFPSPDCQAPVTRTQVEAHDLVVRWAVPFLLRYLAGDLSYEPLLAGPGPSGASVVSER